MNRRILRIAVPSIIANITTPLLGLVDLAIVGHLGSPVYIAAIALGGTVFSMIYWIFAFLRMGTSGMTAQAVGAGDRDERDGCFFRAMAVALGLGAVLVMLQAPVGGMLLGFIGTGDEAAVTAREYFDVLIYGAPATLGIYVLNGWFIGLQNSRLTMWMSLIINVVNITASLLLVYGAGMGIKGVAAGTLTAQWTGFGAGVLMCLKYRPKPGNIRRLFGKERVKRFFSVNTDIFVRTLCLVGVTVWFTRAGARQGDVILSVNALLMQLFILFSYMMDGFAFAGEALVGKYTGSGEKDKRRAVINALFRHGAVIAGVFTAAYALGGDVIMGWLSDETEVLEAAREFRWWAVTIPFAGVSAFIWDGVFIGETRTRGMLAAMGAATAVFFAVWLLATPVMGNHGLWLAFILYLATRGAVETLLHKQ